MVGGGGAESRCRVGAAAALTVHGSKLNSFCQVPFFGSSLVLAKHAAGQIKVSHGFVRNTNKNNVGRGPGV